MRIKLAGIPLIVGFVLVFTTGIGMAAPQRGGQVISPDLAAEINRLSPGGKVSIIVSLKDQVHPDQIKGIDKEDKRRNLLKELRSKSDLTQGGIRSFLKTNGLSGKVSKFTPLWINNAVAVTADSDVINNLATFPEVASITTDAVITGPQVSPSAPVTGVPAPNLSVINAPGMWNLGYQGQGVVIASMDTGVDYTHPDLSAAYRGGSNSWFDPYSQHAIPTDLNGHGTWTLGVMVGGGSSGTILGVAPQAKWIAVKIFDDTNMATTTGIHLGFQWLLDPDNNPLTNDAPNVVNDSWDLGYPGCNLTFEPDIQALVAANISVVFAAGNQGPNGATDAGPANNPNVFSAGATDNNDLIASFSSRGPTSCGRSAPTTFPDVVAPGVAITTTDLHGLYNTVSGTSFAAPHLTGGIALLLSAIPGLKVDQLHTALTYTAKDLGLVGPDATYGNGRIDVLAAFNALKAGTLPTPTATALPPTPTAAPPTATPVPPTASATPIPPTAKATAAPPTATAPPAQTDLIFTDGFESGNISSWTSVSNPGALSVNSSAAFPPNSFGMAARIINGSSGYVVDNSPNNELSYHARFYFNPNSVNLGDGIEVIFNGMNGNGQVVFQIQVHPSTDRYQMRGVISTGSGSDPSRTNWFTITNTFHAIEIAWQSSSNASFSLYIDGAKKQNLTGLDTSVYRVKTVWLGPSGGLSGVSGSEYFDTFTSTRMNTIGPTNSAAIFTQFVPLFFK